jgi:hypothetical protein
MVIIIFPVEMKGLKNLCYDFNTSEGGSSLSDDDDWVQAKSDLRWWSASSIDIKHFLKTNSVTAG